MNSLGAAGEKYKDWLMSPNPKVSDILALPTVASPRLPDRLGREMLGR
jgi:hypothetical protein